MEKEKLGSILFCVALISSLCLAFVPILLHTAKSIMSEWKPIPLRKTNKPIKYLRLLVYYNRIAKQMQSSLSKMDAVTAVVSNWFDLLTYYTVSVTVITCTLPAWKIISDFLEVFPFISFVEPALSFGWIVVSIFATWLIKEWWKISVSTDNQSCLRLLAAFHSLILMIIFIRNIDMDRYKYYLVSYLFFLAGRFVFVDTNKEKLSGGWKEIKKAFHFWVLLLALLSTDILLYHYLELYDVKEDVFLVVFIIHSGILMALHIVKYKADSIYNIFIHENK